MPCLRYRAPKSPSRLEERFLMLWKHVSGPDLVREYRFHHERRWRADFAHLEARVLIEIEGGIWVNGRHNRAAGFNADLEKYLDAGLAGNKQLLTHPKIICPAPSHKSPAAPTPKHANPASAPSAPAPRSHATATSPRRAGRRG